MKVSIKTIAAALLLLGIGSQSFAATTKVTVNGMVCAFCAQGIEKRLSALPATRVVLVDLKHKTVAIEAKQGMKLDEKSIKAEIIDAGYDVVKLEEVPQSVADIRQEMNQEGGK